MPSALSATVAFLYKRYKNEFKSNNLLYKYLRIKSYIIKPRPQKPIVANAITGLPKIFTLFI